MGKRFRLVEAREPSMATCSWPLAPALPSPPNSSSGPWKRSYLNDSDSDSNRDCGGWGRRQSRRQGQKQVQGVDTG